MRFSINLRLTVELNGSDILSRVSWRRLRSQVKKRDRGICQYCNQHAPDGAVDHVIPLSRGGSDELSNLVWACQSCNSSKGDKTPQEWVTGGTIVDQNVKVKKTKEAIRQEWEDADKELAVKLAPWWKEHSDEKGSRTRAVKYLFGEDVNTGGNFWRRTQKAIGLLKKGTVPIASLHDNGETTWTAAFLDW